MTTIYAGSTLNFPVTDATGLLEIAISAHFPSLARTELVYELGAFADPYAAASTVVTVGTTKTFHVLRSPSWEASVTIEIVAIDTDSNVVTYSESFTFDDGVTPVTPYPVPVPTTTTDQIYDALYQAVGDGIRAPAGTIVERWRYARALGLEACTVDARAAAQAFPNRATDFLSVYEAILGVDTVDGESTSDRQLAVTTQYTRTLSTTHPSLASSLAAIDSRFLIVNAPYDYTLVTEGGARAFEDWIPSSVLACGPAFGLYDASGNAYGISNYANVSDHFVLNVLLDTGGGASPADLVALEAAKDFLNETLPAWVDYRLFVKVGFVLDQDLLDVTVFGDGVSIP